VARYVNAVAEAGKREFNIPFYCNVWLAYPPGELPERHIAIAGIGYPSGGPTQGVLPIWKAAAPAIDAIGPDLYSSNPEFALDILDIYARPDNPLWIPETGRGDDFAPYLFAALERGAIGYSPFGIDWTDHPPAGTVPVLMQRTSPCWAQWIGLSLNSPTQARSRHSSNQQEEPTRRKSSPPARRSIQTQR
jgi:hypothetical protein